MASTPATMFQELQGLELPWQRRQKLAEYRRRLDKDPYLKFVDQYLKNEKNIQAAKNINAKITRRDVSQHNYEKLRRNQANAREKVRMRRGLGRFQALTAPKGGFIVAKRHSIPPNGDCLFIALAQGLYFRNTKRFLPAGEDVKAGIDLRKRIVEYICTTKDPGTFGAHRLKHEYRGGEVFMSQKRYCQKMRIPGDIWGDSPEIAAFSKMTNVPVIVYEPTARPDVYAPAAGSAWPGQGAPITLVLANRGGGAAHYDLLHRVQVQPQGYRQKQPRALPQIPNINLAALGMQQNMRTNGIQQQQQQPVLSQQVPAQIAQVPTVPISSTAGGFDSGFWIPYLGVVSVLTSIVSSVRMYAMK